MMKKKTKTIKFGIMKTNSVVNMYYKFMLKNGCRQRIYNII